MSQSDIRNTKNIAKNTVFLYMRSIVIMAVGIYTSRVVLQTLGVDDYGVYNVIGGFVAMFSILSASLVNASQRFISFEMGKAEPQMNRIFCGTISIHLLLALIVFGALETFGVWFMDTQLNIAPERMTAANWVFQCSVLTFCINLISVPYNACIISHERMNIFAYFSIYEAFAKLGIVYLLWITGYDKLIVYAILMLAVSVSLRLIYGIYCKKHFEECNFHFIIDKPLFKEMMGFIGWNFFGSTAGILSTQGINILINIFFGVALNAARGLADQVNNAINTFVNNFMTAMNPQITKSYAAGDYGYMKSLMIRGAKYAAILYWLIALTFFIESDEILGIWLVKVPDYAPIFLRLTIIYSIFKSLAIPIYTGMLASGKIRNYQLIMGALNIMAFVLCYIFFVFGLGPEYGYISTIIIAVVQLFVRLKLISDIIPGFPKGLFFRDAILRALYVIFASSSIIYYLKNILTISNVYVEVLVMLLVSLAIVSCLAFVLALTKGEREKMVMVVRNQILKR